MAHTPQRTAVITGAAGGIGAAYAEQLARCGWHLILAGTGRSARRLHALAQELREECRVDVDVRFLEPDDEPSVDAMARRLATLPVDLLVNGAAPAAARPGRRSRSRRKAPPHVALPMKLTYAVLPGMLRRGAGDIIQVAPAGAGACLRAFAAALAADLAGTGVRIQTLTA